MSNYAVNLQCNSFLNLVKQALSSSGFQPTVGDARLQPIFRGSSQRENEERFTTSVSILSYRILLTESGRRVDFLSGTRTFPYPLVGLHCTNYFISLFSVVLRHQTTLGSNSTSSIVLNISFLEQQQSWSHVLT